MAKKPRDRVTYHLKRGNEVVYIGSTKDPARREAEHRNEGKDFDELVPTSPRMTRDGAKRKEAEDLETYRRGHRGQNPLYNADDDG